MNTLDIPKNLVSYHLKTLRENGYVLEKPAGRNKNYQLHPNKINQVIYVLKAVGLIDEAIPLENK